MKIYQRFKIISFHFLQNSLQKMRKAQKISHCLKFLWTAYLSTIFTTKISEPPRAAPWETSPFVWSNLPRPRPTDLVNLFWEPPIWLSHGPSLFKPGLTNKQYICFDLCLGFPIFPMEALPQIYSSKTLKILNLFIGRAWQNHDVIILRSCTRKIFIAVNFPMNWIFFQESSKAIFTNVFLLSY